jgi:hypothetical protein
MCRSWHRQLLLIVVDILVTDLRRYMPDDGAELPSSMACEERGIA